MSITLGAVDLHRAIQIKRQEQNKKPFRWLTLYCLGTVVGMVGLISIVIQTFALSKNIRIVTYTFGGVVLGISILIGLLACCCLGTRRKTDYKALGDGAKNSTDKVWSGLILGGGSAFTAAIALFEVLAALYSDMILAAIANNWSGAPTDDNQYFYWTYFTAKRLPFFSF
jgi:hypothetical protein